MPAQGAPNRGGELSLSRYGGPVVLILSSLADGPKHGYALIKDIEAFAGIRLAPGTLYQALAHLEDRDLVEGLAATDRRRPYQLTSAGAAVLRQHLSAQRRIVDVGLHRLSAAGRA